MPSNFFNFINKKQIHAFRIFKVLLDTKNFQKLI